MAPVHPRASRPPVKGKYIWGKCRFRIILTWGFHGITGSWNALGWKGPQSPSLPCFYPNKTQFRHWSGFSFLFLFYPLLLKDKTFHSLTACSENISVLNPWIKIFIFCSEITTSCTILHFFPLSLYSSHHSFSWEMYSVAIINAWVWMELLITQLRDLYVEFLWYSHWRNQKNMERSQAERDSKLSEHLQHYLQWQRNFICGLRELRRFLEVR